MTALREGRAWTPDGSLMSRLAATAPYDADLFRAFLEVFTCLALPQDVFQRPGVRERSSTRATRPHLCQALTGSSSWTCCPA
jgi:hypothetical protein